MLFAADLLTKDVDGWRQSLSHWTALVDRGFDEVPGNYLMVRTAMIATASKAEAIAGSWDESEFSATKGLVSRLFYARYKGADADWWRARLPDVTIDTASTCLTVLLAWGTPNVIASLKEDIDSIINGLSSQDWSRLRQMAGIVSQATQARRAVISEDWFDTAGSISPRMALILIGRVEDSKSACRLSRKYFRDYAGDDDQILRRAAMIELIGSSDVPVDGDVVPVDWNYVRHLSKHARRAGVHTLFPVSMPLSSEVPETVAQDVLADCGDHCIQLVAICEQAYAATVAQAAPKVVHIAETNQWFASPN